MRLISICVFLVFVSTSIFAQRGNQSWQKYRHEASLGYGFNTFLSSIGEDDKIGTRFMLQRPTMNASYRYYFAKHFAVRGSFTHAYYRKNDKEDVDPARLNARLDYEMTLSEFAVMAEYHIFDETHMGSRKGKVRRARGGMSRGPKFGVSCFGGVTLDYMRPYAELYGNRMVLKQYNPTAGYTSSKDYKRTHVHFPIGTNLRLVVAKNWRVGVEAGYRIGLTDYIDNVSSVYYIDSNPYARTSEYDDTKFSGEYVSLGKEKAPISSLASNSGRKNYFFGMVTLAYRIKP